MIKGVSRKIIAVKTTDSPIFEQAFFIIRDNAEGVDREDFMRKATCCAEEYVKKKGGKRRICIPPPAFVAAGAALTGAAWLFTAIK